MLPFKVLEEKDHFEYKSFLKGKLVYKIHWRFLHLFEIFGEKMKSSTMKAGLSWWKCPNSKSRVEI